MKYTKNCAIFGPPCRLPKWENKVIDSDFFRMNASNFGVKSQQLRSRWAQICPKMHFVAL